LRKNCKLQLKNKYRAHAMAEPATLFKFQYLNWIIDFHFQYVKFHFFEKPELGMFTTPNMPEVHRN